MTKHYTLYGWHLSYYTGKVRAYLNYKDIPFDDKNVDFVTLFFRVKKHTGARVMPVVRTPQNEWLQDTRCIINELEKRYPKHSIFPQDPLIRFVSELMEIWTDEWWVPHAMHTRWSHEENIPFFKADAGRGLLPWAPAFIQQHIAKTASNAMQSYLPAVGIIPSQYATLDEWLEHTLPILNQHFQYSRFLFGEHPNIADFGLIGPMYGHLSRDPWPRDHLIAKTPYLKRWINEMNQIKAKDLADTTNPGIPESLDPIFQKIATEFLPMISALLNNLNELLPKLNLPQTLPRSLGVINFPMGNKHYQREGLAFSLWKIQELLRYYQSLESSAQESIKKWLSKYHAEDLLTLKIPPLERIALRVRVTQ